MKRHDRPHVPRGPHGPCGPHVPHGLQGPARRHFQATPHARSSALPRLRPGQSSCSPGIPPVGADPPLRPESLPSPSSALSTPTHPSDLSLAAASSAAFPGLPTRSDLPAVCSRGARTCAALSCCRFQVVSRRRATAPLGPGLRAGAGVSCTSGAPSCSPRSPSGGPRSPSHSPRSPSCSPRSPSRSPRSPSRGPRSPSRGPSRLPLAPGHRPALGRRSWGEREPSAYNALRTSLNDPEGQTRVPASISQKEKLRLREAN